MSSRNSGCGERCRAGLGPGRLRAPRRRRTVGRRHPRPPCPERRRRDRRPRRSPRRRGPQGRRRPRRRPAPSAPARPRHHAANAAGGRAGHSHHRSVCEHHLLPFRLDVSIAYVPDTAVLGLSKLVRHLEAHTHALQLQERTTHDVAHDLTKAAATDDVAVFTAGEHLCMSMRGVKATAVRTTTMCRLGRTESDPDLAARIERLALPSLP
ncbi:GTP cyclohydrolase I [Kitasatospora sp. NPDC057512]|uniref:GTP cyclohydrolase I n=1 Tax=Kitasatospora sp. NPDC057512 TaxID=3346154 RepID=UPI0036A434F2